MDQHFAFPIMAKVTDIVTHYCGIVTGNATFLDGRVLAFVEPLPGTQGSVSGEGRWIDESRLILTTNA